MLFTEISNYAKHNLHTILCNLLKNAALEGAIEAFSSERTIKLPLIRPQLTLLQDYGQPLERYDDYEEDQGELRAESRLAEKFGEFPLPLFVLTHYHLGGNLNPITWVLLKFQTDSFSSSSSRPHCEVNYFAACA